MSVAPSQPLPPGAAYTNEPIFRLTVDQYHELIRTGKLGEDDPVELLEGILVYKTPKNTPHTTATQLARRAFERLMPAGWHYIAQDPVTLADGEPEPDGAVVRGTIEDYARSHPGPDDLALVIEVADTSLARDRGLKLRSYARAGVPQYWIVNLTDGQVEVYDDPSSEPDAPPAYRRRNVYTRGEHVPLAIAGGSPDTVAVDELLPPA